MKRIISTMFAVLFALGALFNLAIPASAQSPLLVDKANLLTEEEENKLSQMIDSASQGCMADLVVVTVNDLHGKTAEEYADDFFDYNGYGYGEEKDGVLLLYKDGNQGDRELWISTHGSTIKSLSSKRISYITENVQSEIVEGNYYDAVLAFIGSASDYINVGPAKPMVAWYWIPLSLVIGFLIAFVILKIMTANLKTVKSERFAENYIRQGSLNLTNNADYYIYSNVVKTPIPKSNDNDDFGTHVSSSGETHGGGGSKF